MRNIFRTRSPRGFTIFFATLVTSLALAIGLVIFDLTIRELDLSATATQSQFAIYAADTGAECALYWNSHYGALNSEDTDGSAFSTTTLGADAAGAGEGVVCAGKDIASDWTFSTDATGATTTFSLTLGTGSGVPCVTVEVAKRGVPSRTTIISHGHNTCRTGSTQLERALQVNL